MEAEPAGADGEEPAEHLRYWGYLQALEQVGDEQELALITEVLADPYRIMAESAVVRYMERRAPELLRSPAYPAWKEGMAHAVSGHAFLVKRLDEWNLFRAVALDQPWTPEQLLAASDWLQRSISEGLESTEAHAVLAANGRTRRIRNAATSKLNAPRR